MLVLFMRTHNNGAFGVRKSEARVQPAGLRRRLDRPNACAYRPQFSGFCGLLELESSAGNLAGIVRVIDCDTTGGRVWLRADATAPESVIFRAE
jgi:hypothetical protein